MIKKMLVMSMVLAFAFLSTPSFSQATKGTGSLANHLLETINKNPIEKVIIFSSVKALADGKEIKIISNNLLSIKDGDEIFFINIDTINMYSLKDKVLAIYIL